MITPSRGLPADVLDELAALERDVVAHDGGRLKIEWPTLRSRPADREQDVLVRDGSGQLIGFAGVYRHGGPQPEITGMIAPAARGQGHGARALDAALALAADAADVLLVVPRPSAAGHRLAAARGGVPDHSEHALQQTAPPPDAPEPAGLVVRPATPDDRAAVDALLADGFGPGIGTDDRLDRTRVGELDGRMVASLVTEASTGRAGVYGFVVDAALRGRGIGRAVLARTCRELRADGADTVYLEVEVANERALGLYTSLGFEPVTTEDYYRLATS